MGKKAHEEKNLRVILGPPPKKMNARRKLGDKDEGDDGSKKTVTKK